MKYLQGLQCPIKLKYSATVYLCYQPLFDIFLTFPMHSIRVFITRCFSLFIY